MLMWEKHVSSIITISVLFTVIHPQVYAERNKSDAIERVNLYAGMFAVVGVIAALGMVGQVCGPNFYEFI